MAALTFQEMGARVKRFVDERSWGKYHMPKDIAIALSVEASELLELFQWSGDGNRLDKETLEKIRHETADTVIYAFSMANACGFDLGETVAEKISMNEKKYPVEKCKDMFG
jgi:NTP pyrophosphatase (non-canonical NTP hydrolase)